MIDFIKNKNTSFFDKESQTIVIVDTVLSCQHNYATDVTEFPIASGETITDHSIRKPLVVTLSCVISNTPPVASGGSVGLTGEGYAAIDGSNMSSVANDAYSNLLTFNENRTVLIVSSGLTTLHNMIITSLSIDLSKKTSHALYFNVSLKQVLLVNAQTVDVASVDASVSDATAESQNLGNVNGKDEGESPFSPDAKSLIFSPWAKS